MRKGGTALWRILYVATTLLYLGSPEPARSGDDTVTGAGQLGSQPVIPLLSEQEAEQRKSLVAAVDDLRRQAKYAEAVPYAQQLVDLHARVQGTDHWQTRSSAMLLARITRISQLPSEAQAEFATIDRLGTGSDVLRVQQHSTVIGNCTRRIEVRTRLLGSDDDETAADYMYMGFATWEGENDLAATEQLFRNALATRRRVYQTDRSPVADDLHNLACVLEQRGDYGEATTLFRESLTARRQIMLHSNKHLAISCSRLGTLLLRTGEYAAAEPLLLEAVSVARQVSDEGDWDDERRDMVAGAIRCLGLLWEIRGDDDDAGLLFRESQARYQALVRDGTTQMEKLREEASSLEQQGRHADAQQWSYKADMMKRRLYSQGAAMSAALDDVARVLQAQGKRDAAKEAYEKALNTCRSVPGTQETEARILNNLASLLRALGEHEAAGECYDRALALRRQVYGEEHPDVAETLHDLACLRHEQGLFEQARGLHMQALDMRVRLLGPDHPDVVQSNSDIARLLHDQGEYERAEDSWLKSAQSFDTARLRVSTTGLERVLFAAARSPLGPLAACQARNGRYGAAYEQLERGLSRGLLDSLSENRLRPLTIEEREAEERLLGRLAALDEQITLLRQDVESNRLDPGGGKGLVSRDLPAATRPSEHRVHGTHEGGLTSRPSEEGIHKRLDLLAKLSREHAELRAEWAQFDQRISQKYEVRAGKVYGLAEIQARLSPHEAILVWVDVAAHPNARDPNGEHWACIVRQAGNPRWAKLLGSGVGGAWTSEDEGLPRRARDLLGKPSSARSELAEVLATLYRQRIKPVEPYLKAESGEPAARHLIVLPAGSMAGIPVDALTEAYTISYAPSGTLFAWLREERQSHEARHSGGRLLALGNPVFTAGKESNRPAPTPPGPGLAATHVNRHRAGEETRARRRLDAVLSAIRGTAFAPLPGSQAEVQAIVRVFEEGRPPLQNTVLLAAEASEQRLEELSRSGQLGQFRFIHLATHAKVNDRMAMQSALILSQDKLENQLEQALAGQEAYDGWLTADQIARGWKLDAELVTLSGCDTALGRAAGGEGHLGFSQAFFVAGARSLLLSLWKVDDTATALLMIRFYENLLGRGGGASDAGQRPAPAMRKAEALREAQRWLRELTADRIRGLCGEYGLPPPSALARGELVSVEPVEPSSKLFEHPYYWSAFVLIGDPD